MADKLREALGERGFTNPRVAGLLASGGTLPVGVALEVYVVPPNLPEPLTASDLGRIGRELEAVVGWPVLLWAAPPGEEDILVDERVTYL